MEDAKKVPTNLVIVVAPIKVMDRVLNALMVCSGMTHTATETR
jgi:hypothetical protein